MKNGLSGIVPVRDNFKLDYCAQLAVESLLPVCDEVILSDGGSSDNTRDYFMEWACREPKLRVVDYPWQNPVGNGHFLEDWLNWTRQFCQYDMQLSIDADEVIDPLGYDQIERTVAQKACRWFDRLSFWRDAHHITPDSAIVGRFVAKLGPTELETCSDGNYKQMYEIQRRAIHHPELRIFHYGFLRKQEQFYMKSKIELPALLNTYDPRLVEAEASGKPWWDFINPEMKLEEFHGKHPDFCIPWLQERGRL
jgi:glycosyltransferase involved in cell wall biosynthesis